MQFIVSGARSRTEQNPGNISVHRASCIVRHAERGTACEIREFGQRKLIKVLIRGIIPRYFRVVP